MYRMVYTICSINAVIHLGGRGLPEFRPLLPLEPQVMTHYNQANKMIAFPISSLSPPPLSSK
jgi:hypothetical protein